MASPSQTGSLGSDRKSAAGRVNFIIPGSMRSGTTYLYHLLSAHPQVFMPRQKELHYFSYHYAASGSIDLAAYDDYFADAQPIHKAIGEASPEYSSIEGIPELLQKHLGNIKLIFILRDPVERAYSHYWWAIKSGRVEWLSFEDALQQETARLQSLELTRINYAYVRRGLYLKEIQPFLEVFPRESLFFMLLEEVKQQPLEQLNLACDFLGIDQFPSLPEITRTNAANIPQYPNVYRTLSAVHQRMSGSNIAGLHLARRAIRRVQNGFPRTTAHPSMKPATRLHLQQVFREANQQLFEFLGKPNIWT
ncbi:MAG: sulfotransferase domain-containing protein [Chloroflexota bacterium]